jgi:hypothetical protein
VASHAKSSDHLVEAPPQRFQERHYSASKVGEMWNLSADFVQKMFEHEPGVLVLGDQQGPRNKRRYTTIRIPESVLQRVHLHPIGCFRNV